jgi:hypothetical protein
MRAIRNPRLRFIVEPDAEAGDGGASEKDKPTGDVPQEGADKDGVDEDGGDPFDAERALKKIHKANAENAALRERTKAAEAKAATADDKDKRISALEAEKLRIRIGYRHDLPDELIDRLKGTTEEEILADAEKLLGALASGTKKTTLTQRPTVALHGGGEPATEAEETDPRKLAARVPRR